MGRAGLQWSYISSGISNMSLSELLPTVEKLSYQDKLRLIHFLLLGIVKEEGCSLEPSEASNSEHEILQQLTSTGVVV